MKQIQFGLSAAAKETPGAIKAIYRTLFFLSGFWMAVLEPRFPNISEHMKYMIDSYSAIGSFGIYYICQYFGIDVPTPQEMKQKTDFVHEQPPVTDTNPGDIKKAAEQITVS